MRCGRPKKEDAISISAQREKDAIKMAKMLTEEHMTIRQIAEKTNYCKSTVQKYLTTYIDSKKMQEKVQKSLSSNFNEKHLRGGNATKKMFDEKKKKKNSNHEE